LNILSVSFAAILIGLGDDYSVHTISRYLELRHVGKPLRAALIEGAGTTGVGVLTGSITMALAFFSATFTDFLGVAELGLIAGGGILLCALASYTILPAMVCLADRYTEPQKLPSPFQGTLLRKASSEAPWLVVGFSAAVFALIGCAACDWSQGWPKLKIAYDHNLLNLQAEGLESVEAQKRIFEASQHSLLYAISLADSPAQARTMKEKLEALPTVHRVEELATRLPEYPPSETKLLVQGYHALLAHLPQEPEPPGQADHLEIGKALENLYLTLHARHVRLGDAADAATIRGMQQLDHFLDEFSELSYVVQLRFLGEFEYRMAYALLAQMQALEAASNPEPVSLADLPAELRTRFVSPDGKWLLQIFPKDQIWDMEPLERFVTEIRTVDPEVTGTPLQNFEATRQIKTSYEICAVYALLVILLVLQIDFMDKRHVPLMLLPPLAVVLGAAALLQAAGVQGFLAWLVLVYTLGSFAIAYFLDRSSVYDSFLAITPPGVGLAMALGLLGVLGIPLNPANLIILPLILGIGVGHGVHVVHDYHSKPNQVYALSPSTLTAILLAALTTMVGFGSMMIAAHRGLYSLGAVLTIGVACCTFVALVPLPAVLAMISRRNLQAVSQIKLAEETVSVARVA
jgi:predicted RND superfamily exporter protein